MKVVAAAFALVGTLVCGPPLRAAPHPPIQLEMDPCVDAPRKEVARVLSIELGAPLLGGGGNDRTRVLVACEESLLTIRVDDPITGKSLERTIDLSEAPRARPRLLALAIVELISASWTELESNPRPQVPPAGPRASPEARRLALHSVQNRLESSALRRPRLSAIASGLAFFSGPGLLGGGGLQLAQDHAYHLGWRTDLQAHHGTAAVSLGSASVDTVSFGAALVFHQAWRKVGLHLGAGLRGGAARLSGSPNPMGTAQGKSGWGAWGGPLGIVDLSVVANRRLVFDLGLEAGYVVVPVGGLVAGAREVAVDGAFVGFHVGGGIFL